MQKQTNLPSILSLKEGINIFQSIIDHAETSQLKSAFFTGIGALSDITMGFYHQETQNHTHRFFQGTFEIISLSGNITRTDDGWFVHIHGAIGDENFQSYGGHIISAYAGASMELALTPLSYIIHRIKHPTLNIQIINPCDSI